MELSSSNIKKFLILRETETPKKISYISGNGNPIKAYYISGNETVNNLKKSETWKIQLTVANNFISSIDNDEIIIVTT